MKWKECGEQFNITNVKVEIFNIDDKHIKSQIDKKNKQRYISILSYDSSKFITILASDDLNALTNGKPKYKIKQYKIKKENNN